MQGIFFFLIWTSIFIFVLVTPVAVNHIHAFSDEWSPDEYVHWHHLSAGAIAGIAKGGTLVVGVGVFALIWFVIKKKKWVDLVNLFKKK